MFVNKTIALNLSTNSQQHQQPRKRREQPMIVAAGQPVELACHAYGASTTGQVDRRKSPIVESSEARASSGQLLFGEPIESVSNDRRLEQQHLELEDPRFDKISLVFWYKDQNSSPIYTLDARNLDRSAGNSQLLSHARHYQAANDYQFDPTSEFPLMKLRIASASVEQSGEYKCRVDFRRSPTINRIIRLLVQGE